MGLRYEILKKKYERLYNETLEKNKEILIESFVEYYGEKHRDEIVSMFNEIIFIYYINWEDFSKVEKNISIKDGDIAKVKDLKNFLKYRKKTNDSFKDSFIGSSKRNLLKDDFINNSMIKERLIEIFNYGNPASYYGTLICLPVLMVNEKDIIHEINHALKFIFIAFNLIKKEFIVKGGLYVSEEERKIEELINERASLEIFEIFKRRSGDMGAIQLITYELYYTRNLYLIDEFYNRFKEIIKESLITLNKNNLVQRVGKENYEELVNMVNKYYVNDLCLSRKNKKETKEVRQKLVKKMQKRVINTEELTKEDLEKFYKELEEEGKKVRILNDLPENNEENKNSYHF